MLEDAPEFARELPYNEWAPDCLARSSALARPARFRFATTCAWISSAIWSSVFPEDAPAESFGERRVAGGVFKKVRIHETLRARTQIVKVFRYLCAHLVE